MKHNVCTLCKGFYPGCDPKDCIAVIGEPCKFKRVSKSPDAIIPTRATADSAGYDFYANKDVEILPFTTLLIPTGIKALLPERKYLQMCLRSSVAIKRTLIMPNSPAIIDRDYYDNPDNEGEIFIPVLNLSAMPVKIDKGQRIAQGIILEYFCVNNDNVTTSRTGGLGSTGA